ncbi:MAG: IS66 family insertion sequence element accessory protein TnpB [Verrucomicrobia bacterium]|nr:IS66 family insertion sequence element accessory protein TnpB [Verrucomicrobiota bacterium]
MCVEAIDLRKGFEGLSFIVETLFPSKTFHRSLFCFSESL